MCCTEHEGGERERGGEKPDEISLSCQGSWAQMELSDCENPDSVSPITGDFKNFTKLINCELLDVYLGREGEVCWRRGSYARLLKCP